MRQMLMVFSAAIALCGNAGCAEIAVPADWSRECAGRLQLALPGEADQAAMLFKDVFRDVAQRGYEPHKFSDGQRADWTSFSVATITQPITDEEKPLVLKEFKGILERGNKRYKTKAQNLALNNQEGQAWSVQNQALGLDLIVNNVVFLWGKQPQSSSEFERDKRTLALLAAGLRPRALFDVPEESGLCLPYLFIADDNREPHSIAMTYRLKAHPDVTVNVKSESAKPTPKPGDDARPETVTNQYRSDDYWDNRTTASSGLKSARTIWRFPANRPIEIDGRPGLESFVAVVRDDSPEEDFIYHAVARGDPDHPEEAPDVRIVVEQTRENAIKQGIAPLTEDQVLTLARKIAASVKPRAQN